MLQTITIKRKGITHYSIKSLESVFETSNRYIEQGVRKMEIQPITDFVNGTSTKFISEPDFKKFLLQNIHYFKKKGDESHQRVLSFINDSENKPTGEPEPIDTITPETAQSPLYERKERTQNKDLDQYLTFALWSLGIILLSVVFALSYFTYSVFFEHTDSVLVSVFLGATLGTGTVIFTIAKMNNIKLACIAIESIFTCLHMDVFKFDSSVISFDNLVFVITTCIAIPLLTYFLSQLFTRLLYQKIQGE